MNKILTNGDRKWGLFCQASHSCWILIRIHNFCTALQPSIHLLSIITVYLDFSSDLRCMLQTSLPVHWGPANCILLAASLVHHPLFPFATLLIHTYTMYCVFLCGYCLWTAWPWRSRHCNPLKHRKLFTQWCSITLLKTWNNTLIEQGLHLCQHRTAVSRNFSVCVCVHFNLLVQTVSRSSCLFWFQYEIFPFNQDIAVPLLTRYFISP